MAFILPLDLLGSNGLHPPSKGAGHEPGKFINVTLIVGFKISGKRVKFTLDQKTPKKSVYEAVRSNPNKSDYIRIEKGKNLRLNFILDSDSLDWTFYKDIAFTLKNQNDSQYFYIQSYNPEDGIIVVDAFSSGKDPEQNAESKANDNPFNLFAVVLQESGEEMPIMFDPVIKNPPPGGG